MSISDRERKRAVWRAWYHRTKNSPEQKENRRLRRRRSRHALRQRATELKVERGCAHCGEKHPGCLAFHHVGDDKEFEVSAMVRFGSWERMLKEIEKCIVLCANCHAKEHPRKPRRTFTPRMRDRGGIFGKG